MMRANPTKVGRALADRLRRHRALRTTLDVDRRATAPDQAGGLRAAQPSRATRLRRFLGAARVTPYQLRRGWMW